MDYNNTNMKNKERNNLHLMFEYDKYYFRNLYINMTKLLMITYSKCVLGVSIYMCVVAIFLFSSCRSRGNNDENLTVNTTNDSVVSIPITYNIYLENSGSMKGYFANNECNIKTIINEYYDRISEKYVHGRSVTITLNYINTKIEKSDLCIKDFVNTTENNCTASYTKLDDILNMAMDSLKNDQINLVISDFCFTSDNSNIATAQSSITRLFTTRLNKDNDMAIAIFKYDCDFKGRYYPGGIICSHSLPIYIWAFGSNLQIKEITRLPIKEPHEEMVIQQHQELIPQFEVRNGRMIDRGDNSIIVSKWSKERNSDDYMLKFKVDMSSISIAESYLLYKNNYTINDDYRIANIEKAPNTEIYTYSIITKRPYPGVVSLNLINSIPSWVDKSNFDGNGVPNEGQTLGIKPLIEGVYDAFNNKNSKYLTININLK